MSDLHERAARARGILAAGAEPSADARDLAELAASARETWDPRYARARRIAGEIASGVRDVDGRTADAVRRGHRQGVQGGRPRCGDCHAWRSMNAWEPCSSCGSTQPPDLGELRSVIAQRFAAPYH